MKDKVRTVKEILRIGGKRILFISLFGSQAKGRATPLSDTDIAVYFEGNQKERFDFRLKASGSLGDRCDIHVFQDLPLYILNDILHEGKIIYTRSMKEAIMIFIDTARSFSSFKRHLDRYYEKWGQAIS